MGERAAARATCVALLMGTAVVGAGSEAPAAPARSDIPRTAAAALESRVVFADSVEGTYGREIFSVRPDGSGLVRLTHDDDYDGGPAVSPDGSRIAFSRNHEIWVMRSDGTHQRRVVSDHDEGYQGPSWSPNGRRLVFTMYGKARPEIPRAIYRINVDGTWFTQLAASPRFSHYGPDWSVAANRIAWTRYNSTTGVHTVWTMAPSGGDKTRIPHSRGGVFPAWSPNGSRLAIMGSVGGCDWCSFLYSARTDGTGWRRLSSEPFEWNDLAPSWSPNGRRLAFGTDRDDPELESCRMDLSCTFTAYVMGARGSNQHPFAGGAIPSDWALMPVAADPAP